MTVYLWQQDYSLRFHQRLTFLRQFRESYDDYKPIGLATTLDCIVLMVSFDIAGNHEHIIIDRIIPVIRRECLQKFRDQPNIICCEFEDYCYHNFLVLQFVLENYTGGILYRICHLLVFLQTGRLFYNYGNEAQPQFHWYCTLHYILTVIVTNSLSNALYDSKNAFYASLERWYVSYDTQEIQNYNYSMSCSENTVRYVLCECYYKPPRILQIAITTLPQFC